MTEGWLTPNAHKPMETGRFIKNGRFYSRVWGRLGLAILFTFAILSIFAGFFAPYAPAEQDRTKPSAPPSQIRVFDNVNGQISRPFLYEVRLTDPLFLRYEENRNNRNSIGFFVPGFRYSILGIFESDLHLFGIVEGSGKVHLLGTDALGRDRFSRLVYAVRYSLIAAPVGTLLASILGILIGLLSGYSPRIVDLTLMGTADAMLSLPALIIILAARAAFPLDLPPERAVALLITIFSTVGWAEMARLCRGLVRSLREREFVTAAKAMGAHPARILLFHILPNAMGPIITQATVMLPAFLIAEISLSFLGVGIQEPMPSLGNMLAEASDLTRLTARPFTILAPAIVIFLIVLGVRLTAYGRNMDTDVI